MPEVPDHLGHGGYSGSPFWLAIGPTAAEALRAHGASFFETDAPAIEEVDDVIGALVLLSHRRALGCVVSGSVLDTRPRDALENLRREIQPGPMLIHATGTENPAVRVAARELGIHVWEASPHGAETLTATATEDGPTEPPPREGHVADRNAPRRSPASARRSSRTDVPPRGADRGEPLRAEPPYPEPPYPEARARRSAPLDAPEDGEPPATAGASVRLPRADDDRPGPGLADPGRFAEGCLKRIGKLSALLRYTVRTLSEASNATRISLMLRESERGTLRLCEGRGVRESLIDAVRCPLGSGIAGRVAALGRPVTGHGSPGGAREYTGRAYVVLPLGRGRRCEGVLCLTGLPGDRLPDPATIRLWAKLALRAGVALRGARTLQRARALAVHDQLTRLPNRRAFERALGRELERARRAGTRLVVGLFDVDHFKSFNDRYGHAVGDRVLREVARRLQTAFRETDLVTRWGGEEFAVLLPGLDAAPDARPQDLMERGWGAVRARPFALGEGLAPARVTVSGGYAVFPGDARGGDELLRRADEALYRAKDEGRDRVLGA